MFEEPPMDDAEFNLEDGEFVGGIGLFNVAVSFTVQESQAMRVSVTSDITANLYDAACLGVPRRIGQYNLFDQDIF